MGAKFFFGGGLPRSPNPRYSPQARPLGERVCERGSGCRSRAPPSRGTYPPETFLDPGAREGEHPLFLRSPPPATPRLHAAPPRSRPASSAHRGDLGGGEPPTAPGKPLRSPASSKAAPIFDCTPGCTPAGRLAPERSSRRGMNVTREPQGRGLGQKARKSDVTSASGPRL